MTMTPKVKKPLGMNNFDKLAAASILGPKTASSSEVKVKLEARIAKLENLHASLAEVTASVSQLYLIKTEQGRLKKLTTAINKTKALMVEAKGVTGMKTPLTQCMNELVSLREGVFTNAATDKKTLSVLASIEATDQVDKLLVVAKSRLETLASETDDDDSEYLQKVSRIIKENNKESQKLEPLKTKPFAIARVPVIPIGGFISSAKLNSLGIKAEEMSGYPVIHNQLVLGLNAKLLVKDAATLKGDKLKAKLNAELMHIKKLVEHKTNTKLQLVSQRPFPYQGGTWYWLMPERELNTMAKAFPGKAVKVSSWGFAFSASK